ncbi:MAG: ChbG/HpnK family deacetylase [Gemmataceae bacterium]
MSSGRTLVVVADDYGIGPETSRAIAECALRGAVTATVLLANSPHAEEGVEGWRKVGWPADLGWHPCLTMDAPAAPPGEVPSLVGDGGVMYPLAQFLRRLRRGAIRPEHIERELRAQYARFLDLTGRPPPLVNSHQHVALFGPVGAILRQVLREQSPRPFLRRVQEPTRLLAEIPGARVKRCLLNLLGRPQARVQAREGYPGADWMIGVTDPRWVRDPAFWPRWLAAVPGRVVELMCHPGHHDLTLLGRDARPGDGLIRRRVDEYHRLTDPAFLEACRRAGFTLLPPSRLPQTPHGDRRHAA